MSRTYRRKEGLTLGSKYRMPNLRSQDRCPAEQVFDSNSKERIENQLFAMNSKLTKKGAKLTEFIDGRTKEWHAIHQTNKAAHYIHEKKSSEEEE